MASRYLAVTGRRDVPPDVIPLADGSTLALHSFEEQVQTQTAKTPFVTGPSAAALWQAHEQERQLGASH